MEIIVLLALGALVYWLARSRSRSEQQRAALRFFVHDPTEPQPEHDDRTRSWQADFVTMTAESSFSMPGVEETRFYELKRTDRGRWRMRLTLDSYDAELRSLKELAEFSGSAQDRLAKLQDGNPWERVPPSIEGPLESQYQRFVHQYRG